MVNLLYDLICLLFFDIPLLHYGNLRSSVIFCLCAGDIYLSLSLSSLSHLFLTFVIGGGGGGGGGGGVASAVFWVTLFKAVLSSSVADCLT